MTKDETPLTGLRGQRTVSLDEFKDLKEFLYCMAVEPKRFEAAALAEARGASDRVVSELKTVSPATGTASLS